MFDNPLVWIIAAVIVVFVGAFWRALFSRESQPEAAPEPAKRYRVKLYSGGDMVRSFETGDNFTYGDGEASFYDDDDNLTHVLTGTYVIEPLAMAPASLETIARNGDATRYKITLFDAGKEVRSWFAADFESFDGLVEIYPPDCDHSIITQGTLFIEELK